MKYHVLTVFVWLGFMLVPVSPANAQHPMLTCQETVRAEISVSEVANGHNYSINLRAGDIITIIGDPIGDGITARIRLVGPDGIRAEQTWWDNPTKLENFTVGATGIYLVNYIHSDERAGAYTLELLCDLMVPNGNPSPSPIPISGYGFPGVAPMDFSTGIELPIQLGAPLPIPIGAEGNTVALYTYQATANATNTLTLKRISGDLSIGVAVINKADNTIVFLGGMPSASQLIAELVFPTDGTYTIGIFRLDIAPNFVGTSGAVEIRLD